MDKSVTMTENRLAIRRAFLDGKINAVCGYPGIGKTYLTMIHPIFIDGVLLETVLHRQEERYRQS